jgi:hypothetical protein
LSHDELATVLRGWFRGDEQAVHFGLLLWEAAQQWDDLEDEGRCDHNALLAWLAFDKEYHPFFAAHAHLLRPAMMVMTLSWEAANTLERGGDVPLAYVLRAGIYQVWHLMAWITGGHAHAAAIGPEIWRFYGAHETLGDLMKEFS